MGFHICESCGPRAEETNRFSPSSSGDVCLVFTNGHRWVMPDMILHYVADHGWQPPAEFVGDVMAGQLAHSDRRQTRSFNETLKEMHASTRVGYLEGPIERGVVPTGFIEKLEQLMKQAADNDMRVQTKGVVLRG